MQVNAQEVIDSLSAQVGKLNTDLMVERLMNQKLRDKLEELMGEHPESIPGQLASSTEES